MQNNFYANGKLLITSEYAVLDGAKALAIPTRWGQSLQFAASSDENGHWKSYDASKKLWFEADFSIKNYEILKTNNPAIAEKLVKILQTCRVMKAENAANTPPQYQPLSVTTHLTFPKEWGLGTSSTLIHNLANLFNINAFELLDRTFGGSGYDLACAGADKPILYWREEGKPQSESVDFYPPFADQVLFVYLGQKQDSREAIKQYRGKKKKMTPQYLADFNALTDAFLTCATLADFNRLIIEHERLVSSLVGLPIVKSLHFDDFWGEVKSLGAWGGDFVMVTSDRSWASTINYFNQKKLDIALPFSGVIK
jgi:mevalonate kinase